MRINSQVDSESWEVVKETIGVSAASTVMEKVGEHYGWKLVERYLPPVEIAHLLQASYELWLIGKEGWDRQQDIDRILNFMIYQCNQ